jgi:hypothetical protein
VCRAAPRYHPALRAAITRLDDGRPIADVCRDIAALADTLALPRPSYPHVRRLINEARELRAARHTVERMLRAAESRSLWL